MKWIHVRRITLLPILLIGIIGCGLDDNLQPVKGTIFVGERPASGASLMFHIDGTTDLKSTPATATAQEDGSFTVGTGTLPGIKPGKYIVTVTWPDPSKKLTDAQKMMGGSIHDSPDLLKGRYATRDKSTVRVEVIDGNSTLEPIKLDPMK